MFGGVRPARYQNIPEPAGRRRQKWTLRARACVGLRRASFGRWPGEAKPWRVPLVGVKIDSDSAPILRGTISAWEMESLP